MELRNIAGVLNMYESIHIHTIQKSSQSKPLFSLLYILMKNVYKRQRVNIKREKGRAKIK